MNALSEIEMKFAEQFEKSKMQDFIKFCAERAVFPKMRGKPIKCRRILEIGKSYYWKETPATKEEVPESFWNWISEEGLEEFNSILINVYENKQSSIGWHSDKISNLREGEVVSYSFALNPEDVDNRLAIMEFSDGKKIDLCSGTRVTFNAVDDFEKEIKHRVYKTLCPRLNITLRKVI